MLNSQVGQGQLNRAPRTAFEGGNLIPQAAQANQVSRGSLADAFASLDSEVGGLEKMFSLLAERINPALEPIGPSDGAKSEGQCGGMSPLAEATYDYVRRVRIVVQAMHEMSQRISF